jgi:hypothetical protein
MAIDGIADLVENTKRHCNVKGSERLRNEMDV